MQSTDRNQIQKLKKRDATALREWVDAHYDDVFRFMRHLTRHRETAEDLAQQTFVRALEGLSSFEERSSMRTWLHKIGFREYVRWRRRQRWQLPLDLLKGGADPEIDRLEQGEALISALHTLAAAYREAFLMYEVQGLSVEEICAVTGSPSGTVRSQLHHARQSLRKMLQSTFKEARCEC